MLDRQPPSHELCQSTMARTAAAPRVPFHKWVLHFMHTLPKCFNFKREGGIIKCIPVSLKKRYLYSQVGHHGAFLLERVVKWRVQGGDGVPTPAGAQGMTGCGTQGSVGFAQGLDSMLSEVFSSLKDPEVKPAKISGKGP